MSIVCIGQSTYDISFPLEEPLAENRKYRILHPQECGGGPALNAACLCARWGAKTQLVSKIGTDAHGQALLHSLQAFGVGTDFLTVHADIQTPYSLIAFHPQTSHRTIFNFPGTPVPVPVSIPSGQVDVILSDGHEPDLSIQTLQAHPHAISMVDAGTLRDSTYAVCQKVDYLVCSEDFARQYTQKAITLENLQEDERIFQQIEAINHRHAVITLGERGLLYRNEAGQLTHLPAYPVHAIDTSGAGDIFHGAFAYGLAQSLPLEENLKQSSMASAISVQHVGGQTSIPGLPQVLQQLQAVSWPISNAYSSPIH